jgi:phosphoribosylanthranilate isomerase
MTVKVKICGIRTRESAKAAVAAGADYLGFNFVPSSRRVISVEKTQKIIDAVRGEVQIVGVFKDMDCHDVNTIAQTLGLNFVQLHGQEDASYMKKIKTTIIKKVSLDSGFQQTDAVSFVLLDRKVQGQGAMIDGEKAREFARDFPIFFAGGLTPDNVSGAVSVVQPYGVDVSGGIETNGKEDLEKIRVFIKNAKGVLL